MLSTLRFLAENKVSRSALAVAALRACLGFVLGVLPVTLATAQEWYELDTLTFTPVVSDRVLIAGTGAAADALDEPSPQDEQAPARVIARIEAAVEAIEAEQVENGEHALTLIPLYRALADIYLEIDGYADAIAILEQAQSVVRRNLGLYSLDQASLIEEMIEIDMTVAPSEQSLGRESDLRELVQRNPADARNVGILTRMAGRQMDVVDHLLVHGIEPEFTLNVALVNGPGRPFRQAPTARSMATSMLRQARSSYRSAIRQALSGGGAELSQLFELEDSIIDTFYFELMNPKLRRRSNAYRGAAGQPYAGAIRALEAQLSNIRVYSPTPEAIAVATIEIADWHLMFGRFAQAMRTYDEALRDLRAETGDEARVAALFSPEVPAPLPAVAFNRNVFDDVSNVQGFFEVEIEINRFGGVRNVEVTARSDNASDAIERRLKRFVNQSRFRPRYLDGEWRTSDRFRLRYDFGYRAT